MSSYGVILHFQCPPYTQSKLVRCVKGRVLDDTLGIDWKIPTEHANLSEKDTKHEMLKDFDSPFDINVDLYKQGLMADKEFLERILSMLPEEFQDVYDDTIPEAKEIRKKIREKNYKSMYLC